MDKGCFLKSCRLASVSLGGFSRAVQVRQRNRTSRQGRSPWEEFSFLFNGNGIFSSTFFSCPFFVVGLRGYFRVALRADWLRGAWEKRTKFIRSMKLDLVREVLRSPAKCFYFESIQSAADLPWKSRGQTTILFSSVAVLTTASGLQGLTPLAKQENVGKGSRQISLVTLG